MLPPLNMQDVNRLKDESALKKNNKQKNKKTLKSNFFKILN